jgi:oligopeptide transport system permease protein
MVRFGLKRLATFPLVLFLMYGGAVLLVMAAPGEGLEEGEKEMPPEVLAEKRQAYNYDQPWVVRYFWTWPKRLVWDRDLPSHQYEDWTVVEIMRSALPVSLQLGVLALGVAVMLGVAAGVVSAAKRGRWLDHVSVGLCLVGISLPTFVTGAVLLIVVGIWLRAVPVGG